MSEQHGASARGLRALTGEEFSATEALGGVRGVVESVAPGLLFVVVYLAAGERLRPALIAAVAGAVLAVAARLVQRTPVTQAFSGLLGVAVGVVWAWRSGAASNYFLVGLLTNGAYLVGTALTIVLGFPLVGLVVGLFAKEGPLSGGPWSAVLAWRGDRSRRRAYALATWPWVGMFAVRLAVQVPLYLRSDVAWLGTAKLAMGLPLTALVLGVSWRMVRAAEGPPAVAPEHPAR
ncbi:DUF3159 domain-containing protein [Cellulomonas sp. SG140]|uniref:DUF3159 domain-containing protein n=1 Tax=Cellulomonas sp. SG140 TaxID=2976536 RepID=UPI0021E6E3C6|nr:DUF3159 domain-containing protein [Cellulomonas sp. SG140]